MSEEVEILDKDLAVVQQGILKAAEVTLAAITQMVERASMLEIKGIDDEDGYKAVQKEKMLFVHTRGKVETAAKKARDAAIKYQRDNIKVKDSIIGLMKPTEDDLAAKEKVIDDAKDEIKKEKERLEAERIWKRVARLEGYGMGLRAGLFTLSFDAVNILGLAVPEALLKVANDEQFEKFCTEIQHALDVENARKAEDELKRKAEEERLAKVAAEQEAERQRLAEIARKQEEEARRQAEEAARAKAEQERSQREAQEKQEAAERKLKEERDALEAEKKRIADAGAARLKAIEDEKLRVENEKKRQAELEQARKEAAEMALRQAEEKAKREAQEKADRVEKERIAAEKRAARMPDKKKLENFLSSFTDKNLLPDMKTEEGIAALLAIGGILKEAKDAITKIVEAL